MLNQSQGCVFSTVTLYSDLQRRTQAEACCTDVWSQHTSEQGLCLLQADHKRFPICRSRIWLYSWDYGAGDGSTCARHARIDKLLAKMVANISHLTPHRRRWLPDQVQAVFKIELGVLCQPVSHAPQCFKASPAYLYWLCQFHLHLHLQEHRSAQAAKPLLGSMWRRHACQLLAHGVVTMHSVRYPPFLSASTFIGYRRASLKPYSNMHVLKHQPGHSMQELAS